MPRRRHNPDAQRVRAAAPLDNELLHICHGLKHGSARAMTAPKPTGMAAHDELTALAYSGKTNVVNSRPMPVTNGRRAALSTAAPSSTRPPDGHGRAREPSRCGRIAVSNELEYADLDAVQSIREK